MFEYRAEHKVMVLVNWLGYKAGLENKIAVIPNDAFAKGTRMVQLSWFKENWDSRFIGIGSFDEAQFFTWDGEDST